VSSPSITSPPNLLAIANAARRVGDRDLEQSALDALRDEHGIEVIFHGEDAPALRLEVGDEE
jgi:hypothetical protein